MPLPRFEEANVKDAHRAASDAGTIVADMLTGRPARYIRNALADDLIASALRWGDPPHCERETNAIRPGSAKTNRGGVFNFGCFKARWVPHS
jgi:NAD(P)H-dependent flavin oxidoreductase YrpB (nitropropane dioxygenase family)